MRGPDDSTDDQLPVIPPDDGPESDYAEPTGESAGLEDILFEIGIAGLIVAAFWLVGFMAARGVLA